MNGGTSLRLVWLSRWLATLLLCILGACVLCWSTQYTETNTSSGLLDKIPPPPPLYPQTQFLSFSKFITSYTSLLLLRRSLKSSHPVLVYEYSIILIILPFQNLIIIRWIVLEFEHISAPIFFIPFLLIHINTYSHHSCVCMRVEWFHLVWTYIVLINKMIHILLYFVDLFLSDISWNALSLFCFAVECLNSLI